MAQTCNRRAPEFEFGIGRIRVLLIASNPGTGHAPMVYAGESPVAAFDLYDRFNVFFFSDWQDGAVLAYPLGYRQDQIS